MSCTDYVQLNRQYDGSSISILFPNPVPILPIHITDSHSLSLCLGECTDRSLLLSSSIFLRLLRGITSSSHLLPLLGDFGTRLFS